MKPLISVIIPTYNSERTIEKCINSILNQTFKDIEIIVINDNSTDNTTNILKKYENIILINNNKTLGPSASRNKGLDIARGKYIGFVDSDDYIDNLMYEKMIEHFINDIDLVVCSRYNITEKKSEKHIYKGGITDSKKFLFDSVYIWDKLFKKDIIDKYELRFRLDIKFAEDFDFVMKYRYYSRKTYIMEEPYYYYIKHRKTSICNSFNLEKLDNIKSLESVVNFYIDKNIFEECKNDILEISALYYVNRIKEFKYYKNSKIPRLITKGFLKYFKTYFKNYKSIISTYKSKSYSYYRTNFFLMILYIFYIRMKYKIKKMKKNIRKKIKQYFSALNKYEKYFKKDKINSKMILLESQHGKQVNGNIYYILKELTDKQYKDFKIYLSVKEASKARIKKMLLYNNINNIHFVIVKSLKYYKILSRAKYLINDVSFTPGFIKKEGQVYLNTWHGTPLKALGRSRNIGYHKIGNVQKNFILSDYLLYPNEFTRECLLNDYMFRELTESKIILEGYPRNTAFFEINKEIRKKFSLEDKLIIAFMPTWRGNAMNIQNKVQQSTDIKNILDLIDVNLKENQIVYVNLHPIEQASVDYSKYKRIKPFPEEYETYEFLNIADVLITDYSSVFFDFAITKRKIILFPYDRHIYLKDRGIYFEMDELPFPIVDNIKELISEINCKKKYDETEFLNKYCKYDKKNATKKLLETIILNKNGLCKIENVAKNNNDNVLIVADDLLNIDINYILEKFLSNVDINEKNYFIFFNPDKIDISNNLLKDIPQKIKFFPYCNSTMNLSSYKAILNRLYEKKIISLKTLMLFMKEDYYLETKRLLGIMNYSKIINLNPLNYKNNIIFSKMKCNKQIYLSDKIHSKLFSDNKYNRNMLKYILNEYDEILIDDENTIEKLSFNYDDKKIMKIFQ